MQKPKSESANMPGEGGEGNENHEKKKKNKNWTRPEIFPGIHTGLGTNERMVTVEDQEIV
jgi:hypothetical protein